MSSYQRICREGKMLSKGSIDTVAKFAQLTAGVDLAGKTVLDAGCNVGEMCRMAKAAGAASVRGIDKEPDYIDQARKLNPEIPFDVRRAERCTGHWDFILASAVLHYIPDLDAVLRQFARCADCVLCDVWLSDREGDPAMFLTHRGLLIPNSRLWEHYAFMHFEQVTMHGPCEAPDDSARFVYRLSKPKWQSAAASVFYGPGGSGKTTRARALRDGKGYEHLELDSIFLEWRINIERSPSLSVSDFVDALWKEGDEARILRYLQVHQSYLERWLSSRQSLDIVVEGYDPVYERYRVMVEKTLNRLGWFAAWSQTG